MKPVVLITGASSGIGQHVAQSLASQGYRVYGTSRIPAAESAYTMLPLDVTQEHSVETCVQSVLADAGSIDVLINNAGSMLFGAAEEISPQEFLAQIDLNLLGVNRMVRAVLPSMRQQASGKIINLSSLGGLTGLPYLTAYTASKFAVEGYSEALRLELRRFGIWVSLVEPSGVKTRSLDRSQQRARIIHPDYQDAAGGMQRQLRQEQEAAGLDPAMVTRAITTILQTPQPQLRYLVGRQARMIVMLKRLLPQAWYERMVGSQFRAFA